MLDRMGFKRKSGRVASLLALLACTAVADAAAPREPLVVTALSDPEEHLVVQSANGSPDDSAVDPAMRNFASAISQAAALQQQAPAVRCRSIGSIPATGSIRAAWEMHCRYQRR